MPNQHPDLSFLAMPSTAVSIGTQGQSHHDTSIQLGVGQADTTHVTRGCHIPFSFDYGAHAVKPVNDKTVFPPHSGELHTFLPSHSVR